MGNVRYPIIQDKTSKIIEIFIKDSTSSVGAGLTGLVYNTANLSCHYARNEDSSPTAITLVDMTLGTWASGGFKEIDATNMPGWYQFGIPDAVLASGKDFASINFKGAANMETKIIEIDLSLIFWMWDELLTSARHNIAKSAAKYLRDLLESGGYSGGFVFVNTISGTSGTEPFVNGVEVKPVDNITDALAIANNVAVNSKQLKVLGASSIQLLAALEGFLIEGHGWSLDMNGQSVSGSHIAEADVSGIATGANPPHFHHCNMDNCTIPPSYIHDGLIRGTITLNAAGIYEIQNCLFANGPVFDFGASIGNNTLIIGGGIDGNFEIQNFGANGTDVVIATGGGNITINANCTGGTLNLFGNWTYTDNSGGAVTIVEDGNITAITKKTNNLPEIYKKNIAVNNFMFELISASDGISPATGITPITAKRSIDGGAYEDMTNSPSEIGLGTYKTNISADDLNGDEITWKFYGSGTLVTTIRIKTST